MSQQEFGNEGIPKSQPFNKQSAAKLLEHLAEINQATQSDFFKIGSGEQVEVVFDMEAPDIGMQTKTFKNKDGTESTVRRFNFVIYNMKAQKGQTWACSPTWARKAIQAMQDFNTNNLIIRRKGSGVSDTEYDFLPVGIKRLSAED